MKNTEAWKTELFADEKLNDHSWAALFDVDNRKVVGIYFNSHGIDNGSWPTIIGGVSFGDILRPKEK
jgi:hypothetical protein